MPKSPKHILAIRLSAMGDVAMAAPVLRALTQQYPDIEVTVLTREFFVPFFRDITNVYVFPAKLKSEHKRIYGLYKLAQELNENRFYAVADLHSVLRTKILKKFIRCIRYVSVDKGRKEKKALVKGRIFKPLKTTHQRYADVFKILGYPIDLSNPSFPNPKQLNPHCKTILGNKVSKWIGIAPFAAHEGKMYPLEAMENVVERLSKKHQVILFGGGKKELEILEGFESKYQNVINLAGKLILEEEIDVISNLDVMLSMDSGNAHIAAMMGVKVVTIWGVTHPYAGFAPFNQPENYALLPDRSQFPKIPTSVYGNKYPEDYKKVVGSISPETIVDKVLSII